MNLRLVQFHQGPGMRATAEARVAPVLSPMLQGAEATGDHRRLFEVYVSPL